VSRRRSGDEGQSSVELALVLPFVAVVALLVVQVGVIVHRYVLVIHLAREGARAAAVAEDDPGQAAGRAIDRAGRMDRARLTIETTVIDSDVVVRVALRDPTDVVLVGRLLPDVTVSATTTMRREPP
jgi:hypothetical protein